MKTRIAILAPVALALVACAQAPSAPPSKQAPALDRGAAIRAIRAAGVGFDSAVQVQPLRDPAIDGFLRQAKDAENRGDFAAAVAAADSALKLAPDAPDILQYLAELEIGRSDWQRADTLAVKSFALGPQVGSLCARNWQTVVETRTALDDAAEAAKAKERQKQCRVAPRVRM